MPADTRTDIERYIDEIAPSTIAGQMVKFSKEGKFIVAETEEEISPDEDFVALCDETLIGWISSPTMMACRPSGIKAFSTKASSCRHGKALAILTDDSGRKG